MKIKKTFPSSLIGNLSLIIKNSFLHLFNWHSLGLPKTNMPRCTNEVKICLISVQTDKFVNNKSWIWIKGTKAGSVMLPHLIRIRLIVGAWQECLNAMSWQQEIWNTYSLLVRTRLLHSTDLLLFYKIWVERKVRNNLNN